MTAEWCRRRRRRDGSPTTRGSLGEGSSDIGGSAGGHTNEELLQPREQADGRNGTAVDDVGGAFEHRGVETKAGEVVVEQVLKLVTF